MNMIGSQRDMNKICCQRDMNKEGCQRDLYEVNFQICSFKMKRIMCMQRRMGGV